MNIFTKDIILSDSKVLLRPIASQDIDGFSKIFLDPSVWEYTVSKVGDDNDLLAFINEAPQNKINNVRYSFTIIDKLTGEIAGSSSFGNLSINDKCVEIGWSYIGKKFWGTHVNSHAKFLMLRFAFKGMGMNRVEFKTDDDNPRSGRALIKIGCTKEGVLRSRNLLHNGKMRNTAYYSILASEWPSVRDKLLESFA